MLAKNWLCTLLVCAAAGTASATPSTTYWAPSTTYIQPYLVPHVTYDTYFGKGIVTGQAGSPIYPVTTGLTIGVLPWDKLQLEVGFDLLLPSEDPFLFNAKLGVPEDLFFKGSPSLSFGIFGVGTKGDVTDYNAIHGMVQKNLPFGGYVAAGVYYGLGSKALWTSSDGEENRFGVMAAIAAPDININIPGLKKIVPVADIQTGKNVYGAGGVGLYFYFNDSIDLLTGPVFFFDGDIQPGKSSWLWTVQIDIDVSIFNSGPTPAPAPPAAEPASAAKAPASSPQ
jgi:hypothetical protein